MGPTATGKSDLAVRVGDRLDGEIVSVDSRQAYRGLEVGTAAPPEELRERVPHHGLLFLDPGERYGAGHFARLARNWIREIRARGRIPVLAGGTGFFLSALVDPVFREPPMAEERREALREWFEAREPEVLRRWARRLDPVLTDRQGPLDPQRAGRTLELAFLSGRPLSWWHDYGEPEAPPVPILTFVLTLDGERLKARIRRRAEAMLEGGWLEEVERLREEGHGPGSPAWNALGYRTVARLADGELSREEALGRIASATWQYARRQRTWFRHQPPEDAIRLDAARPTDELAGRIVEEWGRAGSTAGGSGRAARSHG
jgi:tRNA dimethylallyltransferase